MEKIIEEINSLELFSDAEKQRLIDRLKKNDKGKVIVECLIRKTNIILTPEEIVRQLYIDKLINYYKYSPERIKVEYPIQMGSSSSRRSDIVIFEDENPTTVYIIVELKNSKLQEGKKQLASYCHFTGAPMGVWTNGRKIAYFNRKEPNHIEEILNIPKSDQNLQDILNEPFTLKELILKDKILNGRETLKDIIKGMENDVLANAGVDVFEECFKLIFTKLYDESERREDKNYINRLVKKEFGDTEIDYKKYLKFISTIDDSDFENLEFRKYGETESNLYKRIQELFKDAKQKWQGVFKDNDKINLTPSHLSICVSSLQEVKLFNSNLQIIDEAFEYLVTKSSKSEKGQYFTPRHVIDMCVKMLNPKRGEYMIDTASGSCGFPVHTIFKITGKLFSNADIPEKDKKDVEKIFGIDFDEKAVRVARTLNLIAGDGNTNVLHLNTLDYANWDEVAKDDNWIDTYNKGFSGLKKLRVNENSYKEFKFDLLMANPPFAGDIKEPKLLAKYDLSLKGDKNKTIKSTVGRDILFIERNLDFVRPGGRLAIVLPQGRFNNTSDKDIREYIAKKARILAVVGLDVNTFKPHTGTKTSVIFLQKWNDDDSDKRYYCPHVEDYPIFFAVSEKSGKDNSGEYVYLKDENGHKKLDKHGHNIVDHDLHSHEGDLDNGIAEAFIDFAKSEKLSFWGEE